MSTSEQLEFAEMCPHRIRVTSKAAKDDFTYDSWDAASERTYMCLVDESDTIQRDNSGVTLRVGLTAYALAIPINETEPHDIMATDKVEILSPTNYSSRTRPVVSLARHYWVTGELHNITVGLS